MVLDTDMDLDAWESIFQSKIAELMRPWKWTLRLDDNMQLAPGWKSYTLHTSARFRCSICGRRWESSKVRIIFHIKQPSNRVQQGCVNMRIFKQECRKCNAASLEEPQFIIENIDITLDRLVTRIRVKCYGEDVSDRRVPAFINNEKKLGPHDSVHCEACRLGLCNTRPPDQKKEEPTVHSGWDACTDTRNRNVQAKILPPLIHNDTRFREPPQIRIRSTNALISRTDETTIKSTNHAIYRADETRIKSANHPTYRADITRIKSTNHPIYRADETRIKSTNHPIYRADETTIKSANHPIYRADETRIKSANQPTYRAEEKRIKSTNHPIYRADETRIKSANHPTYRADVTRIKSTNHPIYRADEKRIKSANHPTYRADETKIKTTHHRIYRADEPIIISTNPPIYRSERSITSTNYFRGDNKIIRSINDPISNAGETKCCPCVLL